MFRCACLFVLLPLCVLGQAEVLLSTPSESFVHTNQPTWEETHAPTVLPTTEYPDATELETTTEPYVPSSTTFEPEIDTEPTETSSVQAITVASTSPASPQPTNATAVPTNATAVPTSPQPTNATAVPTSPQPTNATAVPTSPQPTNATSTSTPAPTSPPRPEVGDYIIWAEWNSSACLLARMGLQFSFKMGDTFQTINLDPNPNVTKPSGTCGNDGSDAVLVLQAENFTVQFTFTNQSSKFFLRALNFTVEAGSSPFTAVNNNLSLWEASLGSSYMCRKEQSFNITDALILNTFELQVQPFAVMNDKFSTAHECSVDDASLLIPIIVGAALAVLILIVVIAYVIGRRKTYVGYQTL